MKVKQPLKVGRNRVKKKTTRLKNLDEVFFFSESAWSQVQVTTRLKEIYRAFRQERNTTLVYRMNRWPCPGGTTQWREVWSGAETADKTEPRNSGAKSVYIGIGCRACTHERARDSEYYSDRRHNFLRFFLAKCFLNGPWVCSSDWVLAEIRSLCRSNEIDPSLACLLCLLSLFFSFHLIAH